MKIITIIFIAILGFAIVGCETKKEKANRIELQNEALRKPLEDQLYQLQHGAPGEVRYKSDNPNISADLQNPANHFPEPASLSGYDESYSRIVEEDKNRQRWLWHRNPNCPLHINDLGSTTGYISINDGKPCPVCMGTPQQVRELKEKINALGGSEVIN